MANQLRSKTAGILYLNNDWGVDVAKVFSDQFNSLGGQIVAQESFESNANDYKTQLSKIKSTNPDSLLLLIYPGQAQNVFSQIQKLNITSQLFAPGWVVEDNSVLEAAKDKMENIIYAMPKMSASDDFQNKLIARYGSVGENPLIAALAYDSFNIIKQGIEECGDNTNCLKYYLYHTKNYPGVSGKITFDENGDPADVEFVIKTVKNGELVEY